MSDVLVVKLGGTTFEEQRDVLTEIASIARQRPVVLVHGGGKRLTEWLARLGVGTTFDGGLRVTDPAALEVATAVLRGVVNSELVSALRDLGARDEAREEFKKALALDPASAEARAGLLSALDLPLITGKGLVS